MTLADQVNLRRVARGKEPLRIAHIQRAINFVGGQRPPGHRSRLFQRKRQSTGTDRWSAESVRLCRVYTRSPRG